MVIGPRLPARALPNTGSIVKRQMNFVAWPISGEVYAGNLLLHDEFQRGVRRVLGQIAQMDKIEHLVDLVRLLLVVGASDHRSGQEFAIAKVLCKQTVRILAKPLQQMPTVIVGGGADAAAVAEMRQANEMSADSR